MLDTPRIALITRRTAAVATALLAHAIAASAQRAGGCDEILTISQKVVATPYHEFTTITSGPGVARTGGKPRLGEIIWTGTAKYVQASGKWMRIPMTAQEQFEEMKEKFADPAHKAQCRRVSDTVLNGEPATVWAIHEVSDYGVEDTQLWVSRRSGRILQEELTEDGSGAAGTTHMIARFEYDHVQLPAGVR